MDYWLGQRKVHAHCEICNKDWYEPNAQAVGAVHARKYGHEVVVEVLQYIIYKGTDR